MPTLRAMPVLGLPGSLELLLGTICGELYSDDNADL